MNMWNKKCAKKDSTQTVPKISATNILTYSLLIHKSININMKTFA
jgi:hypothetical protein